MTPETKQKIINTVIKNEKLRPLGRLSRLLKDPIHAFPYYILATISHIKPFKISSKTLWGEKMTGYMPEVNTFYYYGYCEANLTSFLLRFLKEESTLIDVGAHIGFYSMLGSKLVGQNGKIFSFEPTPWTYELLKENTKNQQNTSIINSGVSNIDGEISFSDYGPGYGAYNSASKDGTVLKFKPNIITAKVVQLDLFLKENKIYPDFIKLDTEGLEYKILEGMTETLKNIRPLITLEMAGDEKWLDNCTKSSNILFESNYDSYEMTTDGFIKKTIVKPPYTYTNILFIPKEKTNLIKDLIK